MSILKKLKSLAPALSAVVVAACIGVSLHGYSTPVYAVDIPETTKNQTDEDASEQENADTAEKEKKETEESIAECRKIIEQCEKQEKLYTKEEAVKKRRDYNNLYNEGGEGYVPHFYTIEEYEFTKTKLNELLKK